MKDICKTILFAFLTVLLTIGIFGCVPDKMPEKTEPVGVNYTVSTLFTKDGCTVYRFFDEGRERYFTNCRGSTMSSQSCGKSCTTDNDVAGGK